MRKLQTQEDFNKLLSKYLDQKCSPEEVKMIDHWYNSMNNQSSESSEPDVETESKIWEAINHKTQFELNQPETSATVYPLSNRNKRYRYIAVAASVVMVILVGVSLLRYSMQSGELSYSKNKNEAVSDTTKIYNRNTAVLEVELRDGSVVELHPNSEIQFDKSFSSDHREVTLKGEAFFKIFRDTRHPFLVHTQGLVTKVLGTSFKIESNNKIVSVKVKTGKVAVFRENMIFKEELFLTPNQQAVYDLAANKITKQLQEKPQILTTETKMEEMKYEDALATEVFEAIEFAYGIDLVYDMQSFKNCTITTNLSEENLYQRLQVICLALGATYEVQGTQIIITGKGCK